MLVISDIHANQPALEAVLDDAPADETIYCCGDLIGYYPFPNEVIETVQAHDVTAVRGNHDEAMVADSTFGFRGEAAEALQWQRERITDAHRDYLSDLPYTHRATVAGRDVFMVHGSPGAPTEQYVYPEQVDAAFLDRQSIDVDILLVGHTHVPFVKRVGDTLVMNPGSVGQPRDRDPEASYAVLDLEAMDADLRRINYDIDATADAVRDVGLPEMLADRLYDGR